MQGGECGEEGSTGAVLSRDRHSPRGGKKRRGLNCRSAEIAERRAGGITEEGRSSPQGRPGKVKKIELLDPSWSRIFKPPCKREG